MKPHDTKNQASESHHEKIFWAKETKFKEPKKKNRFYIAVLRAEIRTDMTEKQVLKVYSERYPDYNIKIKKL